MARRKTKAAADDANVNATQYFSFDDAATYLDLSAARVRGLVRQGKLQPTDVAVPNLKKVVKRFTKESLDALLEQRAKAAGKGRGVQRYVVALTDEQVEAIRSLGLGVELVPRYKKGARNAQHSD